MCSNKMVYQQNVLKITPWFCDNYMKQNLNDFAPIDDLENKTKEQLKFRLKNLDGYWQERDLAEKNIWRGSGNWAMNSVKIVQSWKK